MLKSIAVTFEQRRIAHIVRGQDKRVSQAEIAKFGDSRLNVSGNIVGQIQRVGIGAQRFDDVEPGDAEERVGLVG